MKEKKLNLIRIAKGQINISSKRVLISNQKNTLCKSRNTWYNRIIWWQQIGRWYNILTL